MDGREKVKKEIIELILDRMEENGKGNLTTTYAIRLLEETIADIEANALMHPVRSFVNTSFQ